MRAAHAQPLREFPRRVALYPQGQASLRLGRLRIRAYCRRLCGRRGRPPVGQAPEPRQLAGEPRRRLRGKSGPPRVHRRPGDCGTDRRPEIPFCRSPYSFPDGRDQKSLSLDGGTASILRIFGKSGREDRPAYIRRGKSTRMRAFRHDLYRPAACEFRPGSLRGLVPGATVRPA